jgi:hypothetical protein
MDNDDHRREATARRAYEIWERDGRPGQRELDHWLAAEAELREAARPVSAEAVAITNLDRALPPAERSYVRTGRQDKSRIAGEPPPVEHFVILADRASVRILAEDRPRGRAASLRAVQVKPLPEGHEEYFERDTSPQGRFPGNTRVGGMSIDERLPMQREQERRLIRRIATTITDFLREHPTASWDLAAGAPLLRAVVDELDAAVRGRLRRTVAKELTNLPPEALPPHFAGTAPSNG